jgi:hypothetical protein
MDRWEGEDRRMSKLLRVTGLLLALGTLWGCDSQVAPGYRGEALLTISGSVEVDSDRERGKLQPALAFYNSEAGEMRIVDVEVDGEFPSDFTLRVYDPPPAEAIVDTPDRPASAVGFITAVTEDHPESVRFATVGSGTGSGCALSFDENGEIEDCGPTESTEEWCTADYSECYRESRVCPSIDSAPEDCEILSSEGDPSLREDPWENFAGLSEFYRLVYVAEPVQDDPRVAEQLGFGSLDAGYHLFEVRPLTEMQDAEAEACHEEAQELATERYNEAHDSDFSSGVLLSGIDCISGFAGGAPDVGAGGGSSDTPDGDEGPQPFAGDGETPPQFDDVPVCGEEPPEEAYEEAQQLVLQARVELDCPVRYASVRLVEDPTNERISVRIGPDVSPSF